MEHDRIEVGDHVRIVNYLKDNKMPAGIVESIDGAYIYVDVNLDNQERHQYKGHYEVYPNEIVKITEQEYFKLILAGANESD
jgi:hypothetical protein